MKYYNMVNKENNIETKDRLLNKRYHYLLHDIKKISNIVQKDIKNINNSGTQINYFLLLEKLSGIKYLLKSIYIGKKEKIYI